MTFEIFPDEVDGFLVRMRENARRSLDDEPGCRQFDVCQSPDKPETIFLYEVYDSERVFQAHLESPHFRAFDREAASMVAAKSVSVFHRLDPW